MDNETPRGLLRLLGLLRLVFQFFFMLFALLLGIASISWAVNHIFGG